MVFNQGMTSNLRSDKFSNWVTGTVDGLEVQAKAFTEESEYGMPEDGRISKLWVRIPDGAVLYSYDRGLDIDHLTTDGLAIITTAIAKAIK